MGKRLIFLVALSSISLMLSGQTGIAGEWNGQIDTPDGGLAFKVKFSNVNEILSGWLDIPVQSAIGLKLSGIKYEKDSINFNFQAGGTLLQFKGRLYQDSISGDFIQAGFKSRFKLKKSGKNITPVNNDSHQELIDFYSDSIKLSGLLSFPEGTNEPYPAILLISGSGGQTRDCNYYGFEMFTILAEYLHKLGYAVLRYDDRGIGESGGSLENSTIFDFAKDAEQAVKFLRNRPDINPHNIGIIGHSEGAVIAFHLASSDPDFSFIISLGGPAILGEDVLLSQVKRVAETDKHTEQEVNRAIQQIKDPENLWMSTFIKHDPGDDIKKVNCPILALYGEKDLQVDADTNSGIMQKYLKRDNGSQIIVLEEANHLFQKAVTGSPAEYKNLEPQFVDGFLTTIGEWLEDNLLGK